MYFQSIDFGLVASVEISMTPENPCYVKAVHVQARLQVLNKKPGILVWYNNFCKACSSSFLSIDPNKLLFIECLFNAAEVRKD